MTTHPNNSILFIKARNEIYNYIRKNTEKSENYNNETLKLNSCCFSVNKVPDNITPPHYLVFSNHWFNTLSKTLDLPPIYITKNEYKQLCKKVWYEKEYIEHSNNLFNS